MRMPQEQALWALYEVDVQTPGVRPAPAPPGGGTLRSGRTVDGSSGTHAAPGMMVRIEARASAQRPADPARPADPPGPVGLVHAPVPSDACFEAIVSSALF
jgi:hypothetical protein